jgi:hypothetical protein
VEHGLSEDAVIAYSDGDLVRLIYEHIRQVDDDELDTRDALYWFITELIERLAPELEWAENVRYYREECSSGEGVCLVDELAATRRAMRRRQGARMIRRALEDSRAC